jgi:hypothetical protein
MILRSHTVITLLFLFVFKAEMKQMQGELDKLLSKGPNRPREKLADLETKLAYVCVTLCRFPSIID